MPIRRCYFAETSKPRSVAKSLQCRRGLHKWCGEARAVSPERSSYMVHENGKEACGPPSFEKHPSIPPLMRRSIASSRVIVPRSGCLEQSSRPDLLETQFEQSAASRAGNDEDGQMSRL